MWILAGYAALMSQGVSAVVTGAAALNSLVPFCDRSHFDAIHVYGDSWSDINNTYGLTNGSWPPSPPYDAGRFSNGPVWSESLASMWGLSASSLHVYAYGGATTDSRYVAGTTGQDDNISVPGVYQQIALDMSNYSISLWNNDVHIIWAGGNNYYDYGSKAAFMVETTIASLNNDIIALMSSNASRILVINMPPLNRLPYFAAKPQEQLVFKNITARHNAQLFNLTQQLNYNPAQVRVDYVDVYSSIEGLFDPAGTEVSTVGLHKGFKNGADPCVGVATGGICVSPDTFIFWDQYHFTTGAHVLIAQAVADAAGCRIECAGRNCPSLTSHASHSKRDWLYQQATVASLAALILALTMLY
jgi:phospholipase/lecithinase/hemolysin